MGGVEPCGFGAYGADGLIDGREEAPLVLDTLGQHEPRVARMAGAEHRPAALAVADAGALDEELVGQLGHRLGHHLLGLPDELLESRVPCGGVPGLAVGDGPAHASG